MRAAILLGLLVPAVAAAVEPLRLEVGALPDGCPATLRTQVESRLGTEALREDAARVVRATLRRVDDGLEAVIALVGPEGPRGERRLKAAPGECEALVAAMALAISIAADPLRALEGEPAVVAPPPPEPALVAPAVLPSPAPASIAQPAVIARDPAYWPTLAAGGLATSGTSPATTAGVTLELGLRSEAYSIALEGRADVPTTAPTRHGDVAAVFRAASLLPCLHAGPWSGCALATAGALTAAGRGIPGARQDTSYYLAGGVRAGFEWAVAARLSLRAWADARAPVAPVRLQVQASDGQATVWQSPAVAVSGGLGLAAHFR